VSAALVKQARIGETMGMNKRTLLIRIAIVLAGLLALAEGISLARRPPTRPPEAVSGPAAAPSNATGL
jgi:hypothetical protein